jgi:soluble lytic murein transglycosylase-like protein
MQILPGTWSWINSNLAMSPLNDRSAADNVHAGVLYLGQLLHDTGGDIPEAVAAYYQGLGSVREQGMLPDTRRYVKDVLALRARFLATG